MRIKHKYLLPVMMIVSGSVYAGENLGDINVTAESNTSPTAISSKIVTIIDRKTIEASHAQYIVDLLQGQANIIVRDTSGTGAKAIVDLGGYGDTAASNKVVLIDGRRVSNPDIAEADWAQIPLDQVERIEIVHGGGSVLYGDGAVGGVINIITRLPESGGEVGFDSGSFQAYGGRARVGSDAGNIHIEVNVSGNKTDGYRDNSKLERYDGGARFEVDISDDLQWYASGNHHRDRFGLPGDLTPAEVAANPRQTTEPGNHGDVSDSYISTGLLIAWNELELDLPLSFRRRESFAHFGGAFPFDSASVLRTLAVSPKLNLSHPVGDWSLGMTAGADIERVDGTVTGLAAERDRDGYYGQLTLSDASDLYVLSAGLRTEEVSDALKDGSSAISDRLNAYDLGASMAMKGFRLRLNHNRSIRFPRLDERTEFLPPLFSASFRPDLKPQTGKHYSASLNYAAEDFWAELSFQRADIRDELYLDPTVGFFGNNENYDDPTRHDVLILSANWQAHDWATFNANYTYTRATFHGGVFDGMNIPGVPKSRVGASWQASWCEHLATTLFVTYVGESYLLNDQSNTLPTIASYVRVDAIANYAWRDAELFVRVENLTNRKYITTGAVSPSSGAIGQYPAAEIAVRGGVSYSF
ncbi:MAG: TonB-dependent receptor [Mariprofundaceae bacterium]